MGEISAVEITVDRVIPIKSKTLPGWYPPILFAVLAIAFYLVVVSFNSLPAQLQMDDEVCKEIASLAIWFNRKSCCLRILIRHCIRVALLDNEPNI